MIIKKYPQSHLIITGNSTKLIIDPGSITFSGGFKPEEFQGADAYLFTHTHQDHLDTNTVKQVVGEKPCFGNADVVRVFRELGLNATQIHDRDKFSVGGFEITPVDLPHCKMQDGTDGPPNTGFLINPDLIGVNGVLFHPGDGDEAPAGLTSQNVALPIAGPTITMEGALQFAKDLQAKVVVPIHYDFFKADPNEFKNMAAPFGIEVRPLAPGEETEI
ncbi:MBL fold metallo-hydrolase [Candidatus Daviesbacteria bacterium]|nr:MBL fold metallo-hydrolase [Candidatus Daviesbacteria bacterium]